jgi:ubiquinone/menaquinone biosynthesis C-methylase UbiE
MKNGSSHQSKVSVNYEQYYAKIDDDFIRWRNLSSIRKAKTISILTKKVNIKVDSILDIGAGLGDVTEELMKQNYAKRYALAEISSTAIDYLSNRFKTNNCTVKKLEKDLWESKERYTIAILSHVLEHLEKPEELLAKALKVSDYVCIEVPLENCLIANFFAKLQKILKGKKRTENLVGHVQFFNKKMILDLVNSVEGRVIETEIYFPEYKLHVFGKSKLIKLILTIKYLIFLMLYKLFHERFVVTYFALITTFSTTT